MAGKINPVAQLTLPSLTVHRYDNDSGYDAVKRDNVNCISDVLQAGNIITGSDAALKRRGLQRQQ